MHDDLLYVLYFIANVLAILLLLGFVIRFANRYLHLIIHLVLLHGFLSVLVIESGQYIVEQGRFGMLVFSSLRLFLYLLAFYLGWYFSSKVLLAKPHKSNFCINPPNFRGLNIGYRELVFYKFVLLCVAVFLASWSISIALNWPPPLFKEGLITRFVAVEDRNVFSGRVFTFVPIILGFLAFRTKGNIRKSMIYFFLAVYFALILLNAQKFGGFFGGLIYFFAAKYLADSSLINRISIKRALGFAAFVTVFFSALLSLVLWHYQTVALSFNIDPSDLLFQRIFVLQGHLWYAVDTAAGLLPNITTESAFTNESFMIGMMELANPNIDIKAINEGASGKFTFGFPAVMPYLFGHFFGVLLTFFVGTAVFVALDLAEVMANSGGLLVYLVSIYAFITIFKFIATGDFFELVSLRSLIVLMFFFTILILRYFCSVKTRIDSGNSE